LIKGAGIALEFILNIFEKACHFMKNFKSTIIFTLIISSIFSGCWFVRVGIRNMGDAIFSSPEPVSHKIKDPVKDNVRLSALWIGHSSVLLQMDDKVILVDPVFENVIAGVMLRKTEAGLNLEDIPRLDAVLISHAHMDHMSLPTLKRINEKFPDASLVFPKGVEKYLPEYDMEMIMMQTGNSRKKNYVGETKEVNGVKITTVFAKHQGGRYGLDSYTWNVPGCTGYIIEYNGMTVFYAGDTIYDDNAFKAIGRKYKINLALIPIGPCRDCEDTDVNGTHYHVSPFGALKILDDLNAEYMIPVHYGAIYYFNDPDTPADALRNLIEQFGSNSVSGTQPDKPYKERIKILKGGEQYIFEYKK
jgi:N-acyl-phosphatidylethanolamine-hydrolysing phospholipase D